MIFDDESPSVGFRDLTRSTAGKWKENGDPKRAV